MAKNLRAKIPATDTLVVRDVNEDANKRFVGEAIETARSTGAAEGTYKVEIAGSPREVAEKSVSGFLFVVTNWLRIEPEHDTSAGNLELFYEGMTD